MCPVLAAGSVRGSHNLFDQRTREIIFGLGVGDIIRIDIRLDSRVFHNQLLTHDVARRALTYANALKCLHNIWHRHVPPAIDSKLNRSVRHDVVSFLVFWFSEPSRLSSSAGREGYTIW